MTEEQTKKCHKIIHAATAADVGGNLIPIPGTGFAADTIAITAMAVSLAAVFGKDLTKAAAEAVAIAAIKKQALKQPIKTITKELSKLIPFAGPIISGSLSAVLVEAAGWSMAKQFELECANQTK